MRMVYLIGAIVLSFGASVYAADLKPFESDQCSAFPEGTPWEKNLWRDCCIAHDVAYWQGGTYADRLDADKALEQCVSRQGQATVGLIMLVGVRVGGSPFFPTAFRWGYGWPFPRWYGELTEHEQGLVKVELDRLAGVVVSE